MGAYQLSVIVLECGEKSASSVRSRGNHRGGDDEAKPARSGSASLSRLEFFVVMRQMVGTRVPNAEAFPALRGRPLAFLYSYVSRHPSGHLTVLLAVLVAV